MMGLWPDDMHPSKRKRTQTGSGYRSEPKEPGPMRDGHAAGLSWSMLGCGPKSSVPRPIRGLACWDRLAAGYDHRTTLALCCKRGAALFYVLERLALRHKQAHTL